MADKNHDEIDLGYIFEKIASLFRSFVKMIFMIIAFFTKYIIVIVFLLIVGVVLGYFSDKNKEEVFKNELIVIPNFDSSQYFYDKVNALSAKIKSGDTVFLKNTLGSNYDEIRNLEAKPVIDLFKYNTATRERMDMFKSLTEKQNVADYIEDSRNFQYYKYHHLDIYISGKAHSEELVTNIIEYLNDSEYFTEYKKVGLEVTMLGIETYKKTISQIDSILEASANVGDNKNAPTVSVSDNSQLNDVIQSKEHMLYKLLEFKQNIVDEQEIIRVTALNYNVKDFSKTTISNKIKYPILLVLLFSGFFLLRYLYKKMKVISETDNI